MMLLYIIQVLVISIVVHANPMMQRQAALGRQASIAASMASRRMKMARPIIPPPEFAIHRTRSVHAPSVAGSRRSRKSSSRRYGDAVAPGLSRQGSVAQPATPRLTSEQLVSSRSTKKYRASSMKSTQRFLSARSVQEQSRLNSALKQQASARDHPKVNSASSIASAKSKSRQALMPSVPVVNQHINSPVHAATTTSAQPMQQPPTAQKQQEHANNPSVQSQSRAKTVHPHDQDMDGYMNQPSFFTSAAQQEMMATQQRMALVMAQVNMANQVAQSSTSGFNQLTNNVGMMSQQLQQNQAQIDNMQQQTKMLKQSNVKVFPQSNNDGANDASNADGQFQGASSRSASQYDQPDVNGRGNSARQSDGTPGNGDFNQKATSHNGRSNDYDLGDQTPPTRHRQ